MLVQNSDNTGNITVTYYPNDSETEEALDSSLSDTSVLDSGANIRLLKAQLNKVAQTHRFSITLNSYSEKPKLLFAGAILQQRTPETFMIDYEYLSKLVSYGIEAEPGIGINAGKLWCGLKINSSGDTLKVNSTTRLIFDYGDDLGVFAEERYE